MIMNDIIRLQKKLSKEKENIIYELERFGHIYFIAEDDEFKNICNKIKEAFDLQINELQKRLRYEGNKSVHITKIQCRHCKDILTDDINEYQTCSCGKISFDTSDTTDVKMYRIVGNDEDVEIII